MHRIIHRAKAHVSHLAHKSRHHLQRKRNKFLLGILLVNILLAIHIWSNVASFPNTYIGSIPVGAKTRASITSRINRLATTKRNINIHGRIYQYSYEDLGVYIDIDRSIQHIWEPNAQPFPTNVWAFLTALVRKRVVEPDLIFSDEYMQFIDKTIYDFSDGSDITYMDQSNKTLGYIEQTQRYSLDPFALQIVLSDAFASKKMAIDAPVIPVENLSKQAVEQANDKLSRVYDTPLEIIIGTQDAHQVFTLTKQALKESTIATVSADKTTIAFVTDADKLDMYLAPLFMTLGARVQDKTATAKLIANNVKKALTKRFDGIHADSVGISLDGGPNSDGSVAHKYIEVDISQQKLYTFDSGALIKTYRVSTGKDYPTPVGTFTILNKAPIGFSDIYNVWMPWWMGFSYSNELHAYFGIHELPYAVASGVKIQRPSSFLGAPNTGGCVALDVGEAREVYQFADVGTKVVIFN